MKKVIAFLLCLFIIIALFFSGCTSNPQLDTQPTSILLTQEEQNNLLLNGNILTKMLVLCTRTDSSLESPRFNYIELLARCLTEKEPAFKYYNLSSETYPAGYIVPRELCNTVINQITGHDIDIKDYISVESADDKIHIITETGWGLQPYKCGDYVYSSLNEDRTQVVTTFELMLPDSSSGDPGHKPGDRYNAYYSIIHEEGHGTYLRLDRFEKE